jgi:Putative adhesin
MSETRTTPDPTVRELPLAAGGELELRLGSNRLHLRTTDGNRVVIRGRTDHDLERDLEIQSGTGWIRVTDGPAGSLRFGPLTVRSGGHVPDLDVEVPRNVRISARTLSGDIEAVGIAGPSRWQSASGSIRIGADAGPLSIDTVSGDAYVDARAPLAITCRTVSGSVKLRAPRITALDVATTSGDVTVDAALDEAVTHTITSVSGDLRLATDSEVTVDLQSVTGDIRASVPHRIEGSRGRRTAVLGSGRVRVAVRTLSGDVKLRPGFGAGAGPNGQGMGTAAGEPFQTSDAGPRTTFWADFGRDWAASAKDWAQWGKAWAEGLSWGRPAPAGAAWPSSPGATQPATPQHAAAPDAPAAGPASSAFGPSAEPEPSTPSQTQAAPPVDDAQPIDAASLADNHPRAAASPAEAVPDSLDDTSPVAALSHEDIEAGRLEILRQLERGELDVETAAERLAALEGVAGRPEG